MKMKRILAVLLLITMAVLLTGCGDSKTGKFTVTRVATTSLAGGVPFIEGTYNGRKCTVNVINAFKDCKVTEAQMTPNEQGEATLSVTGGDGNSMTIDNGIDLTVQDADGKTRKIHVEKDLSFDAEKSGDDVVLILPAN